MIEGLTLTIKTLPSGQRVLHFPFMSISDLHWGTKYSRAKKTTHMLRHTACDRLALNGDIIDGLAMMEKRRWNFGPWHRQGMAEILRKADSGTQTTYYPGNHDEALRGGQVLAKDGAEKPHRNLFGKRIYNIGFEDHGAYTAPDGKRFLIIHGDKYDDHIFKSVKSRAFWYNLGDRAYTALYEVDHLLQKVKMLEHFSVAAAGKKAVKTVINKFLGIRQQMAQAVDSEPYDGAIYGHSHMAGFQRTPADKLLINDGCCTEHVQALVHDVEGRWALLEWHKSRLAITTENGIEQSVSWDELALPEFKGDPEPCEDGYTVKADRLLRIMYRLWPPQERQAYKEASPAVRPLIPVPRLAL